MSNTNKYFKTGKYSETKTKTTFHRYELKIHAKPVAITANL